ncbi:hypothetical protein DP57_5912 [Burkholderia pseudomallei]|nr:hypothetical protein DP57_5912 [Burkholderia pseudomallei]
MHWTSVADRRSVRRCTCSLPMPRLQGRATARSSRAEFARRPCLPPVNAMLAWLRTSTKCRFAALSLAARWGARRAAFCLARELALPTAPSPWFVVHPPRP